MSPTVKRVNERTGINMDYSNQWILIKYRLIKYSKDHKKFYEWLGEYPLTKYGDRHHQIGFVTRKNKKQVYFLDRIVDEMEVMLEDESKFNYERVDTLVDRAFVLIYGKKSEDVFFSDETN